MSAELMNKIVMNNALIPRENLIVGGQPSIDDLRLLKEQGVESIVNLRQATEPNAYDEAIVAQQLGFSYYHIPLSDISTFTIEAAQSLKEVLDQNRPCLVHCATGNRVGALIALVAFWLEGHKAEHAIELGLQSGLTIFQPQVTALMQQSNIHSH